MPQNTKRQTRGASISLRSSLWCPCQHAPSGNDALDSLSMTEGTEVKFLQSIHMMRLGSSGRPQSTVIDCAVYGPSRGMREGVTTLSQLVAPPSHRVRHGAVT